MRRKFLLILVGLAAALFGSIAGGTPVFAHNTFVDTSPREGEILAASPSTWTVTFQKSVPLESASGSVINGDGTRSNLPAPRHGATDNVIVFDFPTGLSGAISARWRLVSTDGHVISGRVGFSVQDAATNPSAPATAADTSTIDDSAGTPDAIRATVRFFNFAAIVLIGGLLFVELDIATGALSIRRARRLITWGAGILAMAPAVQLLILADDVRQSGDGFTSALGDALSMTPGAMLLVRTIAGVALAWLVASAVRAGSLTRTLITPIAVTAGSYLVTLAYVGHSRSQSAPWLGVPVDVVHTAAIAVWLGGLLALVVVIVPAVDASAAVTAFSRFSFIAQRAVVVIAITGAIQTLRLHGNPANLFSSGHGLLLIAKVALVGVMIRLAMRNRRSLEQHHRAAMASSERSRELLLRATTTEVLFGFGVLAVTAVLVAVTPG